MKKWRLFPLACVILGIVLFSPADEGMWMPHQMKDLNLKDLGLQMNAEDLYKKDGTGLMSAVVSLGGGTGEFVSPDGLILTNHHVAFGAIQRASTKEKDYIQNGFLAQTRKEEISASGYIADVLLGYEDVTALILAKVKSGMTYRQIYDAIENAQKNLVAQKEKEGKDIRCTVASMYSGNRYYLFTFKRIKDIRLVYAPPQDLGNFGGEVDNWMWPRHTCDFSFLRAYVSRDNVGVDYSTENVPYKPKSILKISLEGIKEGDFTFVMGYPGRTFRNYTLSELQFDRESLTRRTELYKEIIRFYENASKGNREVEIKYASKLRGLSNSMKNYQGKLEGMEKVLLEKRKEASEKIFEKWAGENPERQKKYGSVLSQIDEFMKRYRDFQLKNDFLSRLVSSYLGATLLSQAYLIHRTVEEFQKPDKEREPAYQERNLPYIKQSIQLAERGYDLATDRAFLKYQLNELFTLPENRIPSVFQPVIKSHSEQAVNDFVDNLYNQTILASAEKRLQLIGNKPDELLKLQDPMIRLAAGLEKEMKVLREEGKALGQEREELKKIFEQALLEQTGGRIAPDANSTIRFTYGFVEGYAPRDAVYYLPQTTLKGVIEKDKGEFPFRVPEKLKELSADRDYGRYMDVRLEDIPCCFLNTTNVTGGNSGSPTLNSRGEQIGIIFDMTYESVIGDYTIIPELQRTISVDIRYVLFITEKFSGATPIIKELGL
ncbi:MAG: S46 family peptidase [Candidatus Aminicenantales bacterium]